MQSKLAVRLVVVREDSRQGEPWGRALRAAGGPGLSPGLLGKTKEAGLWAVLDAVGAGRSQVGYLSTSRLDQGQTNW